VDKGIPVSPVYDYYTAVKYGKQSTGNGFFAPEKSHGTGFTNIRVSGENASELKNGIIAYDILGFHTCNETTGDLKLVIGLGALVKNGEVVGGVRNLGSSGNLADLLKHIEITEKEKTYYNIRVPELILKDVTLI
jgi:predicted Zn-dependent protease